MDHPPVETNEPSGLPPDPDADGTLVAESEGVPQDRKPIEDLLDGHR